MIKNLWNKFVDWLFNWQKEEKDPHLEMYEDPLEPEIPIHIPFVCPTHDRFKKSCPDCMKQAQGHV